MLLTFDFSPRFSLQFSRFLLALAITIGGFGSGFAQQGSAKKGTSAKPSAKVAANAEKSAADKAAAEKQNSSKAATNQPTTKAPDPDADEELDLVSNEDLMAFLESLGAAVDEGKLGDFNRHIDWDGMSGHASRGFQIPLKSKGKFLSEFRAAQDADSGFAGQVIRSATTGGSYTLVKVHEVGPESRAMFRMVLPDDGGFNYHDYVIKQVGKSLKVSDVYIYGSGEMLTSTMRRAMIIAAASQGPEWLKNLTGRDLDMAKSAKTVREYSELAAKSDPEGVLALYAKLPKSVQMEKGVLLVRLYAAAQIDDKTQATALADIRKSDPKDLAGDMQLLSNYLSSQKYVEFSGVISRINKMVGGDPYLNVVLAGMEVERQDYATARKLLEEAVASDDSLIDAWWSLVTVSLREKNFKSAITSLEKLAVDFGVDIGDVTRNAEYADFVKSKEFAKWKQPRVADKGDKVLK